MAIDFVPIDLDRQNFAAAASFPATEPVRKLIDKIRTLQASNQLPTELRELPQSDTLSRTLSVESATNLGLPVAVVSTAYKRHIFVQQFQRYKAIEEGDERVLVGVGVRWMLDVQQLDTKASLTNILMLTASAQLGLVQAEAKFDVIGMSSPQIDKAIPDQTMFNIDSYAQYSKALQTIKDLMWKPETTIQSRILSIPDTPAEPYSDVIAKSWALKQIAKGMSRRQSTTHLPDPRLLDTVTSVYIELVDGTEDASPSESERDSARAKLRPWGLA